MRTPSLSCILCNGLVAYTKGLRARFDSHMSVEHGITSNFNYILAGCLMNQDERNVVANIIEEREGQKDDMDSIDRDVDIYGVENLMKDVFDEFTECDPFVIDEPLKMDELVIVEVQTFEPPKIKSNDNISTSEEVSEEMFEVQDKKSMICAICKEELFNTKSLLLHHKMHTKTKNITLKNLVSPDKEYSVDGDVKEKKSIKCNRCHEWFVNKKSLWLHNKIHKKEDQGENAI
jgi:hypothetical protein